MSEESNDRSDSSDHDKTSNSMFAGLQNLTDAAPGTSRRRVLSGAAALGLASFAVPGSAGAIQEDGNGDGDGGSGDGNGGDGGGGSEDPSEVDVLNYALTLEHLEYSFYRDGLEEFDDSELQNAEVLCERNAELNESIPERLDAIRQHEKEHVDALTGVVKQLGGDPVQEACYDFGYKTPSEFLQTGALLENTGVSAYDGAIHFLSTDDLVTAGATIATVEARHASFLNTLNNEDPFPNSFDKALSMDEVLNAAGGFIVECE